MENEQTITLQSNDGTKMEISRKAAEKSLLLKRLMGEFSEESLIQLNNEEIEGETLKQIVEYLSHYKDTPVEQIKEIRKPLKSTVLKEVTHGDCWAADFIDKFQPLEVVTLANASSFFELPSLSNLCCAKIAAVMIKHQEDGNKLRELFNLQEDMTDDDFKKIEEEEAKMNPYELMIRNSISIAQPYDDEMDDEEK